MKTAVIIISVAVLILLLLVSRLRFTFESMDGVNLTLRFLFIRLRLYPKKKKKIRLGDYSLKKFKENKNRAETEKKRAKMKNTNKKKNSVEDGGDIKSFLISCLKIIVKDFPKRVRTEQLMLHITVCGKDAAVTALKFGAANQFCSLLCSIIDNEMPMKNNKHRSIVISPDYIREKNEYKCKITLSIAIASVFICAGKILAEYVSSINDR